MREDDRRMTDPHQDQADLHRRNESQADRPPIRNRTLRWLSAICFALLAAAYLLYIISIPFGLVDRDNRLGTSEIVLAVALLSALAFAAQDTYALTDLSFGSSGVSARFRRRVKALEEEVRALQVAVAGLVTKHELEHLGKLALEGPALARWRRDGSLESELYRLDAIEFLTAVDPRGIDAIRQDHAHDSSDFDLKDYVKLTSAGEEYLALREAVAARDREAPA
jgi:hypothetical protein